MTRLIGSSVDIALGLFPSKLVAAPSSAQREAFVAALNGVLGDYLASSGNPLATTMTLRHNARVLAGSSFDTLGPKWLLLIHGLCMSDRSWLGEHDDHGGALAEAYAYTPLTLRYNSGLHVSENGRALADLLERSVLQCAHGPQEIAIVPHSMGGLVARSALHYAAFAGHVWPAKLQRLACLGTPHAGAGLERVGNLVDVLLGLSRYSAPFARLGKIRSAGITDLRYGNVLDEHWQGKDRFAPASDPRGTWCAERFTVLSSRRGFGLAQEWQWLDLCNGNGHRREHALRQAQGLPHALAFALAARRLNDWVPEVRQAARERLVPIAMSTEPAFVTRGLWCVLSVWQTWLRMESSCQSTMNELIASPKIGHGLLALIRSSTAGPARRVLVQAGRSPSTDRWFLELAQQAVQPSVRALSYCCLLLARVNGFSDRAERRLDVRHGHLRKIPHAWERALSETLDPAAAVRMALGDRSVMVRKFAADYLLSRLDQFEPTLKPLLQQLANDPSPHLADRGRFGLAKIELHEAEAASKARLA